MRDEKTTLSNWFPRLQASGVKVSDTRIVKTEVSLTELLDGNRPCGYETFMAQLKAAAQEVGPYPIFLRTGLTSGKHQWRDTCYVPSEYVLARHVTALVEYSELADICGLPTNEWVVRKFIPMESEFLAFNGFPVNRERRYFIRDGQIVCHHPYWPKEALEDQHGLPPNWEACLEALNTDSPEDERELECLALKVAQAFKDDGYWCVDFSRSKDDWIAIDMCEGERAYHWTGCKHGGKDDR
jgi:hypothetical protein